MTSSREPIARAAKAIVGSSAASSAIATLALALFNSSTSAASSADAPLAYLAWVAITFIVTALIASTVGLAWHAVCQRRRWRGVHAYWIAAGIVGVLPGALWLLPSGSVLIAMYVMPYGALLGGLTGFFAWLIRRPDRDAPNPPTPAS